MSIVCQLPGWLAGWLDRPASLAVLICFTAKCPLVISHQGSRATTRLPSTPPHLHTTTTHCYSLAAPLDRSMEIRRARPPAGRLMSGKLRHHTCSRPTVHRGGPRPGVALFRFRLISLGAHMTALRRGKSNVAVNVL